MGLFSRFGNAFGELGTHLKGNGFVKAWKEGGAGLAGKRVLVDTIDSTANWGAHHPDKDGIVRMQSMRMQLRHPYVMGWAAGTVGGAGLTAYQNRRDGGHRSITRRSGAGGLIGMAAGLGYMNVRYNLPTGTFGNLRGAPGAFLRGIRA